MSVTRPGVLATLLCCALSMHPARASGKLDPAFAADDGYVVVPLGVGEGAGGTFLDMIVDSAGRIVATGFQHDLGPGGSDDVVVSRLLEDGSLDPGFGVGGIAVVAFDVTATEADAANALFETADGRYVACGVSETDPTFGAAGALAVVRLLGSGAMDTSFDLDGRRTVQLTYPGEAMPGLALPGGCAATPDGGIVLAGSLYTVAKDQASALLLRLHADGSLDTTFADDGVLLFDPLAISPRAATLTALAVQPDGSILGAGFLLADDPVVQYDLFAVKVLADGSLDPSFGDAGVRVIPFDQGGGNLDVAAHLAVDGEGSIYLLGYASTASAGNDFALVKLQADGSLDAGFGTGGRALLGFDGGGELDERAGELVLDDAGRILLAGSVQTSDTDVDLAVARLTPEGALDGSFASAGRRLFGNQAPGEADHEFGAAIALDRAGRVVVAGSGSDSEGSSGGLVLRLTGELLFRDGFETPP